MLTMGRLVAAVLFAGLAWYASQLIIPRFPEGFAPGRFAEVNALIAMPVAWKIAGSRAGDGWAASLSYGLTTTVAMVVTCLFLQSFGEMIRQSLKDRYDGPISAVTDVFEMMVEFGQLMIEPTIIGVLVGGGIIAGLLVEITGRNFR